MNTNVCLCFCIDWVQERIFTTRHVCEKALLSRFVGGCLFVSEAVNITTVGMCMWSNYCTVHYACLCAKTNCSVPVTAVGILVDLFCHWPWAPSS